MVYIYYSSQHLDNCGWLCLLARDLALVVYVVDLDQLLDSNQIQFPANGLRVQHLCNKKKNRELMVTNDFPTKWVASEGLHLNDVKCFFIRVSFLMYISTPSD